MIVKSWEWVTKKSPLFRDFDNFTHLPVVIK